MLDNCEHLIGPAAAVADRLLGECPRLRILATSREPLGITGEALWPVEPLALPPGQAGVVEAMSYPAVRLLADRAAAARHGFAVTQQTVADVVRICRALDGLPLAIELAAARLRSMTVEQLAGRLHDRFRLLTGGDRTALPRHQTLHAVVDWSWELLSDQERVLLRRLAMFSGGATAEAAQRVCADGALPADQVLDLLDALTDKSLLVTAGDGRYRMLETIKAYGLERLDQAGERDRIRQAHGAWFAELAETADPHLRRAEQLIWLHRLAADDDNITAALRGAFAAGDARTAVRLVAAAGWYWWLGGHKAAGAELIMQALAVPGEGDAEHLAVANAMLALFDTAGLGDERQVEGSLRTAQRLAEQTGSRHPVLRFLEPLARLVQSATDGTPVPADVLDSLLDDEDPWLRAQALLNRARMLLSAGGPHTQAQADIETALAAFRAIGERWGTAFALTSLAEQVARRGDLSAAHDYYEQAIVVLTEIGTIEDIVWFRVKQAQLSWLLGDAAGCAAAMAQAEREAAQIGWPDAVAGMAHAKAELARWQGDVRTAREQLARAQAALRHIVIHPVFQAMILDSLAYLDTAEGNLDPARAHRTEALTLAVDSRHASTVGQVLVGIADLALRQGSPQAAAQLLAASDAVRGGPDLSYPDGARVEKAIRAALGEQQLAEAAQSGRDATMSTVRELAASILDGYRDGSR
jgi:predicted ATPase